jgi:hypothetical protein
LIDTFMRMSVLLFILIKYILCCMKYWELLKEREIRHRVFTKVEDVYNYYSEIL